MEASGCAWCFCATRVMRTNILSIRHSFGDAHLQSQLTLQKLIPNAFSNLYYDENPRIMRVSTNHGLPCGNSPVLQLTAHTAGKQFPLLGNCSRYWATVSPIQRYLLLSQTSLLNLAYLTQYLTDLSQTFSVGKLRFTPYYWWQNESLKPQVLYTIQLLP